jgi:hypothetical protein
MRVDEVSVYCNIDAITKSSLVTKIKRHVILSDKNPSEQDHNHGCSNSAVTKSSRAQPTLLNNVI